MIRFFLLTGFIVLLGSISSLTAQSYSFGINAGVNVASLGGNDAVKSFVSYHVGIAASKEINSTWSLEPRLLFSVQGAQEREDRKLKLSYYYVNLPIYFKAKIDRSFSFVFGPQFSALLNATRKNDKGRDNVTGQLNPFDIAVCAGINVSVAKNLQLQANYNFGLLNTSAFEGDDHYSNRVLQVGVIAFLFNKEEAQ